MLTEMQQQQSVQPQLDPWQAYNKCTGKGGEGKGGGKSFASSSNDPAYESRTRAVFMNFMAPPAAIMNDDERRQRKEEAFNTAKEELGKVGIPAEWYDNLAALHNGKGAEMDCDSHGHLQAARSKVSLANKVVGQASSGHRLTMFLDVAKTKSELRPSFLTHRASDIICDIEKERDDPVEVQKDMRGKCLKVGNKRVGYSLGGVWMWTVFAVQRYLPDSLEMAGGYTNGY